MTRHRPSIHLLVVVIVGLPIVLISVALMVINNMLGHRIETTMSSALARSTAQQIRQELQTQLLEAERLSDLYDFRYRNGIMPVIPSDAWAARFHESLRVRPRIASITYAIDDGRTIYVMRVNDKMIVGRNDNPHMKQISEYDIDTEGNVDYTKPMNVHRYDPISRPWYIDAQSTQKPAWTDVYTWFLDNRDKTHYGTNVVGLGFTRRLRKDELSGILLVDITLESVSRQIADSELAKLGTVLLLDDKNRVVARSDQKYSSELSLVPVSQLNDPDAKAVAETVSGAEGWQSEVKLPHLNRTVQFQGIMPSRGLNWRLATVLPVGGLTGQINTMFKQAAIAIVAVSIVALALGIWMIRRWATRPIMQLADYTRDIGAGNFDRTIQIQSTAEFEQLSEAFNQMTLSLRSQIKLQTEKESAEHAIKTRTAFFHRVTHELRTPLNAIIGYSEMLDEYPSVREDAVARDDLRKLRQASKNLLRLINDLLDLARVESGRMTTDRTDIDIRKLIQEVEETTRPLVEKNGNNFRIECNDYFPIYTDRQKLLQVLINLVVNAGKYTSNGDVVLRVTKENACTHFHIADTGPGIAKEKIQQMFEPFTRGKSSSDGTGLGLSIVKHLTELLGGEVEMSSIIGKGTCVDLYLPDESVVHLSREQNHISPRSER